MSDITVVFAGPGFATPEAITCLMNEYLGFEFADAGGSSAPSDQGIETIFPLREESISAGILNVLAWVEDAGLPFTAVIDKNEESKMVDTLVLPAHQVLSVTDVNATVVEMMARASGEKLLVLLWGEGEDAGDEQSENLLYLASAEGIKALDLTAGVHDIVLR